MKRPARTRTVRPIRQCRDVIGLLTEFLEGALSAGDVRRMETHLAGCPACLEFLETLKSTRAAVGTLGARDVPEECRRALRAFLKKKLKPRRR
jgi:anti-sigma factor RsiW